MSQEFGKPGGKVTNKSYIIVTLSNLHFFLFVIDYRRIHTKRDPKGVCALGALFSFMPFYVGSNIVEIIKRFSSQMFIQ